jgi:hypothetical protein
MQREFQAQRFDNRIAPKSGGFTALGLDRQRLVNAIVNGRWRR